VKRNTGTVRRSALVFVVCVMTQRGAPAAAQSDSLAAVLTTPASVRFAGFNGAGAALVGHAANVFTNPAGLATIRHIAVESAYQTGPDESFLVSSAVAWRVRQFDLGVGVRYRDLGRAGDPSLGEQTEGLGVGTAVYRFGMIALGASVKGVRQRAGDVSESGVSGDLGAVIAIFDIMAFGFAVQNIGGNWDSNSPVFMPRLTRFGFTMNYVDPQGTFRLLSMLEWQWPDGLASRFVLGGEAGVVLGQFGVVGRLAYGSRPDLLSTLPQVTYGVTLEMRWVDFDFATETNDRQDFITRRFGLRFAF